jgi:HlyD family secretion protein
LATERQQLSDEKGQYIIYAPISGTVHNMAGIYEGSFAYPNQVLAEISPDTGLVAECYIPPKDIGLIRKNMQVNFQVSAFDYNQWGILTGKVVDISNDITVVNDQPVFTVRASLDQTYMELKNGYRGNLKKGMTLQAHFTVARRSLFQLLYDNVDDWLNPQWSNEQVAINENSR